MIEILETSDKEIKVRFTHENGATIERTINISDITDVEAIDERINSHYATFNYRVGIGLYTPAENASIA